MSEFARQYPNISALQTPAYHIKTHGGLGDILWVYKKLCNLPHPLFVSVSQENRTRPRRTGRMLDHLPHVAGWAYDDSSFLPNADWPPHDHPACCIDRTWASLHVELNQPKPLLIECNRWLEGARRLEGWLPDLPTTHHFTFRESETPGQVYRQPYAIVHIAGWPDIADRLWKEVIEYLTATGSDVYLVSGSYEKRAQRVMTQLNTKRCHHLMDMKWEDMVSLLKGAWCCVGHASGFTAMADILKVPGIVRNPDSVPRLNGMWHSNEIDTQVHVTNDVEFVEYVKILASKLSKNAVWPPTDKPTYAVPLGTETAAEFVAVVRTRKPTALLVMPPVNQPAAAAVAVTTGLKNGTTLRVVALVGDEQAETAVKKALRSTTRSVQLVTYKSLQDIPPYVNFDAVALHLEGAAKPDLSKIWRLVAAQGLLAVGGPQASVARQALDGLCGSKMQDLGTAWWYVYRGA